MDVQCIGKFLAQLRKEQGLTQEELGQKLGVTNKTVSRWETGSYLPPVELLLELSRLYDVSINDLLSGRRLQQQEYAAQAEENIKTILKTSSFTLKERVAYYKRKWRNEHKAFLAFAFGCPVLLFVLGLFWGYALCLAGLALGLCFYAWQNNAMMIYVEDRAYDGSGLQ